MVNMQEQPTWRDAIAAQNARLGIKNTEKTEKTRENPEISPMSQNRPGFAPKGRVQHVSGEMNGLEKKYALFLEQRRICGEIRTWKFEAIKLRLAKATFYGPDFMVVALDGRIELHETKAHAEDDWRVKHKVAVEMFPEFKFVVVKWNKNTRGWEFNEK